jgi:hypothetical protein
MEKRRNDTFIPDSVGCTCCPAFPCIIKFPGPLSCAVPLAIMSHKFQLPTITSAISVHIMPGEGEGSLYLIPSSLHCWHLISQALLIYGSSHLHFLLHHLLISPWSTQRQSRLPDSWLLQHCTYPMIFTFPALVASH